MSYKSIMVHLQLGQPHDCLLQLAASLAECFDAQLTGIAASQSMQMMFGGEDPGIAFINENNDEVRREMAIAEANFRSTLVTRGSRVEWQSTTGINSIADYVAQAARSADLILTGSVASSLFDSERHMNIDHLVTHTGRPVLIIPPEASSLQLDKLLVAWDDSREARRAIADALPLLKSASSVTLVQVVNEERAAAAQSDLDKVIRWLALHDIVATASVPPEDHGDARQLNAVAIAHACDLVIAGAYGHSQLREWLAGGVTQALIHPQRYCTFLSH